MLPEGLVGVLLCRFSPWHASFCADFTLTRLVVKLCWDRGSARVVPCVIKIKGKFLVRLWCQPYRRSGSFLELFFIRLLYHTRNWIIVHYELEVLLRELEIGLGFKRTKLNQPSNCQVNKKAIWQIDNSSSWQFLSAEGKDWIDYSDQEHKGKIVLWSPRRVAHWWSNELTDLGESEMMKGSELVGSTTQDFAMQGFWLHFQWHSYSVVAQDIC